MNKETRREKIIRHIVTFFPMVVSGLLLIFGDASDLHLQIVAALSVFISISLIFYHKQVDGKAKEGSVSLTRIRHGDQALVVSLWGFGASGVLFDGWALHLEVYFQTTAALAVMYILLAAFRIDRLVRRTAEEEETTLDLMEKIIFWREIYLRDIRKELESIASTDHIKNMGKRLTESGDLDERYEGKLPYKVLLGLAEEKGYFSEGKNKIFAVILDAARSLTGVMKDINEKNFGEELGDTYINSSWVMDSTVSFERKKAEYLSSNEDEEASMEKTTLKEFKAIENDLTKFVNSKQQGNNSSELIATGIIGFALVALMQLGIPETVSGIGLFSVHLSVLFTSTVVMFLFCNILDLEKDRRKPLYWSETFPIDVMERFFLIVYIPTSKKWVFSVSLLTVITYVVLLWDKLISPISFMH